MNASFLNSSNTQCLYHLPDFLLKLLLALQLFQVLIWTLPFAAEPYKNSLSISALIPITVPIIVVSLEIQIQQTKGILPISLFPLNNSVFSRKHRWNKCLLVISLKCWCIPWWEWSILALPVNRAHLLWKTRTRKTVWGPGLHQTSLPRPFLEATDTVRLSGVSQRKVRGGRRQAQGKWVWRNISPAVQLPVSQASPTPTPLSARSCFFKFTV